VEIALWSHVFLWLGHIKKVERPFFKVWVGRFFGFFPLPLSFVDMEKYEIKTAFSEFSSKWFYFFTHLAYLYSERARHVYTVLSTMTMSHGNWHGPWPWGETDRHHETIHWTRFCHALVLALQCKCYIEGIALSAVGFFNQILLRTTTTNQSI
jgi:hypothetical protein